MQPPPDQLGILHSRVFRGTLPLGQYPDTIAASRHGSNLAPLTPPASAADHV